MCGYSQLNIGRVGPTSTNAPWPSHLLALPPLRSIVATTALHSRYTLLTPSPIPPPTPADMIKSLQLTYNRTRQAVITRELIEIISGAAAV